SPWRAYWSAHLLGAPGPPEVSFPTQSPKGLPGYLCRVNSVQNTSSLPVSGQAISVSVLSEN
ncbi:hypothetical protein FD754_012949, partial [Muntiacus muntjak]